MNTGNISYMRSLPMWLQITIILIILLIIIGLAAVIIYKIAAAERIKANVKNTMVLEDSYNGLRAAKSADMIPVMIPDLLKANEEITKLIYKETQDLEGVVKILESYEN